VKALGCRYSPLGDETSFHLRFTSRTAAPYGLKIKAASR
jgi:hypothetical protein